MKALDDIGSAATILNDCLKGIQPDIAIVSGSGLADGFTDMQEDFRLSLSQLPSFPEVAISGQRSLLSSGTLYGRRVLAFQGRYHVYEGYNAWQVTAQVRLAAAVGCRKVLLTNAAGGIVSNMSPGDFMLVSDHLNLTGHNPLVGRRERTFVDLSQIYNQHNYSALHASLQKKNIALHQGVLAWMIGPSYETPAEINFLEKAGAAAVSMSTVPEAIVARRYGLEVSAVSLIANQAAGRGATLLNHQDVLAAGQVHVNKFRIILEHLLAEEG